MSFSLILWIIRRWYLVWFDPNWVSEPFFSLNNSTKSLSQSNGLWSSNIFHKRDKFLKIDRYFKFFMPNKINDFQYLIYYQIRSENRNKQNPVDRDRKLDLYPPRIWNTHEIKTAPLYIYMLSLVYASIYVIYTFCIFLKSLNAHL